MEAVFSFLSEKPVAAASLGQVYKGTLRPELGGGDVAVKVQRPGVLEQVRSGLKGPRGDKEGGRNGRRALNRLGT